MEWYCAVSKLIIRNQKPDGISDIRGCRFGYVTELSYLENVLCSRYYVSLGVCSPVSHLFFKHVVRVSYVVFCNMYCITNDRPLCWGGEICRTGNLMQI